MEDGAVLGSLQRQIHYCNVTLGLPLVRSVFCLSRRPLFLVIVPLPWLGFATVWPKGDLYSVPGFIITELNIRSFCGLLSLDGASTNEEAVPSDVDSPQQARSQSRWAMADVLEGLTYIECVGKHMADSFERPLCRPKPGPTPLLSHTSV